jgi:metallophosphoesterase (TIGR00282 family)
MDKLKVLFIADVVGKPGRFILAEMCRSLKEKFGTDYVIANTENAAGGFGITPEMCRKIFTYGVNCQTSGNHIWDRMDILKYLDEEPRLLRPANYPPDVPGKGLYVDEVNGIKIGILNLMGRTYMKEIDCPFRVGEQLVARLREETDVIIVDFHAEATSEKQALLYYLDGKVSAIIGTHTHVQTADEMVTERGTAYITDVGMTGPHDSIIGMAVAPSLGRFLTGLPKRFSCAKDDIKISGAVITIDPEDGAAEDIEKFRIDYGKDKPSDGEGEDDSDNN